MKTFAGLCLALLLAAGVARCYDFAGLKPEGYVSDFAHVLDPARRASLEQYCAQVEKSTRAQLAFVTVPSLQGEPIEDVANSLFRKWGIGQKGTNEGLLLLLVPGDKRFRMEVGYGLEPIIPDGYAGSVLRSMRPALREGRYGEALEDAAHAIGDRIAKAKNVSIAAPEYRPHAHRPQGGGTPAPIGLILGGLFLFWLFSMVAGRRGRTMGGGPGGFLPGLIIGNVLGRTFGDRSSGGGFGGYDSGDSFGGFGGGDSGGGGASSDW